MDLKNFRNLSFGANLRNIQKIKVNEMFFRLNSLDIKDFFSNLVIIGYFHDEIYFGYEFISSFKLSKTYLFINPLFFVFNPHDFPLKKLNSFCKLVQKPVISILDCGRKMKHCVECIPLSFPGDCLYSLSKGKNIRCNHLLLNEIKGLSLKNKFLLIEFFF